MLGASDFNNLQWSSQKAMLRKGEFVYTSGRFKFDIPLTDVYKQKG